MALFSERKDDGGKIAFAGTGDNVCRAWTISSHPHVERPVEPEGKATRRLVELHGGHAEIENDAVDFGRAPIRGDRRKFREAALGHLETAGCLFDNVACSGDRALIPVDADDAGPGGGENGARIAASAEGRVDIDAAVTRREPFGCAAGEHGDVTGMSASGSGAVVSGHRRHAPKRSGRRFPVSRLAFDGANAVASAKARMRRHTVRHSTRPKTADGGSFLDLMGYHWTTWDANAPALTGGGAAALVVD